jgi:apolipoprotein N-acyltransferase
MPSFSNSKKFLFALPVVSGILSGLSILYLSPWLAWIMLVPLFYSVLKDSRQSFLKGFICGSIQGVIIFSWIVGSVGKYTGTEGFSGYLFWFLSSIYFGLIAGIPLSLFIFFNKKNNYRWWVKAIIAACIWVLLDWFRTLLNPGTPWLYYEYFVTQIKFEIPLQLAAFTGAKGLTFCIIFINVLLAEIFITKIYLRVILPISIYFLLLFFGYLRLEINPRKQKTITIALVCENIEAKKRWSSENSDSLIALFYKLNKEATKVNPQLIVWSETSMPWQLAMDDNVITNCLKITWPCQAGHIMGIYSPSENNKEKRYNSAYYIKPDGAITGRYDKMQLLTFIEKPMGHIKLPFFNRNARTDLLEGKKRSLLYTPYGKAGILICNESLIPKPSRETLKTGADFFVVLSNDAWFEGCQLNTIHFYYNRLRALEFGINTAINSNRGLSGIIDSKGRILVAENGNKPKVVSGIFQTKSNHSFYAKNGDWLIVISAIFLIFNLITIITTKSKKL